MSYLDLLPKKYRGGYLKRLRATVALLSVLTSLILVAGGIVILTFDVSLREIIQTTLAGISSSPKERAAEIAMREANLAASAFDAFRATGDAVAAAAAAAPTGIRFDQLVLDAREGLIIIDGFAASVLDVIRFKEALDATGMFSTPTPTFSDLRADGSTRFLIEARVELTHI